VVVTEGGAAILAVMAAGTAPLTFQWRRNGETVPGATSATLALTGTRLADAGDYTAIVTNRIGAAVSSPIELAVVPAAAAPVLVSVPTSLTALAGANVSLAVGATGTPPLSFQWRKEGVSIPGATATTLALGNIQAGDAGNYSVLVSNAVGAVTSPNALLGLVASAVAPAITSSPLPQAVGPGGTAVFRVAAEGTAPLSFQWRRNGTILAGATGASLLLNNLQAADAGTYGVTVSNSAGASSATPATLSVLPPAGTVSIVGQPSDIVVGAGGRATLQVVAAGAGPLSYEWRRNGVAVGSGSALALANVQAVDAGFYAVAVSNAASTVMSRAAAVTLRGRSFAGTYFGSFGTGGTLALYVRDDHSGVVLGFATGARVAFASGDFVVEANGRFRAVADPAAASGAANRAAAPGDMILDAVIGADGSIAGSVTGLETSITARRAADDGPTRGVAGYFPAGANGSAASAHAVVGPSGQAFALIRTAGASDGGLGTVEPGGRLTIVTADRATFAGTVSAAGGTLAATLTTAAGGRLDFAGGSDVRPAGEKLANIATRGLVGGGAGALIAGFVISGEAPKEVLIRAIGPTLGAFGVGDALPAVRLELFSGQSSLATNVAWGRSANVGDIVVAATRAGAFALAPSSLDAVLLVTLEPGAYTAIVSGEGAASGVALVEVYDVGLRATRSQKVINIASRAFAGSGERTLTAGFVISGEVPKRVLIRGVGPTLATFGVSGALSDPQLALFSGGSRVAGNDNWSEGENGPAIAAAAVRAGAFALGAASRDAALLLNLNPGPYTVQLSGAGSATGTALIEVYEAP
jgi:hypothetical protein